MRPLCLLLLVFSSPFSFALECPDYSKAPACPTSKSTLLDDTYPVQAYVISNAPFKKTSDSSKVTVKFLESISDSYDNKDVPQLILSLSTKEEFDELSAKFKDALAMKNLPEEQINKIMGQLTHAQAINYTWQQDYFESFVNLETGRPVLREVESYPFKAGKISDISATGGSCGMSTGEVLKKGSTGAPNAEMGGNIEGAPGGFCLVGDNQAMDYATSFCKDEKNVIQLKTSWLTVGHVDEIFKIIPTNLNDGRPPECQFSIMAASPKKAFELMKGPNETTTPIFDFDKNAPQERINEYFANKPSAKTAKKVCSVLREASKERQDRPSTNPAGNGKSVFLETIKLIFNNAFAGAKPVGQAPPSQVTPPPVNECLTNMLGSNNYEFGKKLSEDAETNDLNTAVQESIDHDKKMLKEKILSRLPQCKSYYDEIDVPNIFTAHGGGIITDEKTGAKTLKVEGNVNSLYPNPTNSVVMNKTILLSDPENKTFGNYLAQEFKKRGLKTKTVSTWDYAHTGDGNLHCSTHSIPYCKGSK